MEDTSGDMDRIQEPEGVPSKRPGASRGRSKRLTGPVQRETAPEDAGAPTGMSKVSPSTQGVTEGQVMGQLTIKELEMMRKMEELRELEPVPVGGTTNIRPEVIASIAGLAAESVLGVVSLGTPSIRRVVRERLGGAERKARGVAVEAGKKEAILDINLRVVYGYSIPQIVVQVRESVADGLLRMCGLEAKEINIRVTSIEFPDRMPGRVQ